MIGAGKAQEVCERCDIHGRPCLLLATALSAAPAASYVIAVAADGGAPVEMLLELLRGVNRDYWHGSYFFK